MHRFFGNDISGGGISGDDASRMTIDAKFVDPDDVVATQLYEREHKSWFKPRPKASSTYKSALELPQNQDVKSKLMNKKPK